MPHRLLNAICASHGVHSKSVRAFVTQALATIINLGKLAALVKVSGCTLDRYSGDQLPAVYNGSYSPHERALIITRALTSLQLSSLQRAATINNIAHLSQPRMSGLANGASSNRRDSPPPSTPSPAPAPHSLGPPPHVAVGLPPSPTSRPANSVTMETANYTLETTTDLDSDVEFVQLPVKMMAVPLTHGPNRQVTVEETCLYRSPWGQHFMANTIHPIAPV